MSQPSLLRVVSRWEILALSVNDVVGSGVYLLPASAALLLGPASVWAVPAAGLCVLLIVLCFAEAGSRFDDSGGAYVYTRAAFGDFIGFEVGWMSWVARVSSAAGLAAGENRVADASADSLLAFVRHAVEPGAVVITYGLQSYRGLAKLGYRHDRRVVLGNQESADPVLPRIHRVASLLKRWLLGTHQGGVSREHLDYYLDEFTFRFNRRTSRHRGKLFYRLLEQAVAVGPVPYAAMVKGIRGLKKKRHHNG